MSWILFSFIKDEDLLFRSSLFLVPVLLFVILTSLGRYSFASCLSCFSVNHCLTTSLPDHFQLCLSSHLIACFGILFVWSSTFVWFRHLIGVHILFFIQLSLCSEVLFELAIAAVTVSCGGIVGIRRNDIWGSVCLFPQKCCPLAVYVTHKLSDLVSVNSFISPEEGGGWGWMWAVEDAVKLGCVSHKDRRTNNYFPAQPGAVHGRQSFFRLGFINSLSLFLSFVAQYLKSITPFVCSEMLKKKRQRGRSWERQQRLHIFQ